jgi:hypothetical protein
MGKAARPGERPPDSGRPADEGRGLAYGRAAPVSTPLPLASTHAVHPRERTATSPRPRCDGPGPVATSGRDPVECARSQPGCGPRRAQACTDPCRGLVRSAAAEGRPSRASAPGRGPAPRRACGTCRSPRRRSRRALQDATRDCGTRRPPICTRDCGVGRRVRQREGRVGGVPRSPLGACLSKFDRACQADNAARLASDRR